jgi:hypothetical protein
VDAEVVVVASATEEVLETEEAQCETTTVVTLTAEIAHDPTKRDFHSKLMISFNQI